MTTQSPPPKTILIVEDDEGVNRLILKTLQRNGYKCFSAATGAEAITLSGNTEPYTLMLLDYQLPDMTGQTLVEHLVKNGHAVPFIIMTGYGDQQTAVSMMKLGARDYLIKESGFIDLIPRIVDQVIKELKTEEQLTLSRIALTESEQRFKALWDAVEVGIFIIDPKTHIILDANPMACSLASRTPESLIGHECHGRIITTKRGDCPLSSHAQRIDRKEYHLLTGDDREIPVLKTVTPMTLGSREVYIETFIDISERAKVQKELASALTQVQQRQKETEALLLATKAILHGGEFSTVAHTLFTICRDLINAQSGYVALLTPDGQENEVLFLEAGNLPCSVDPSLPMPIRGLPSEAYATGKPAVENDFNESDWMRFMPPGHVHLQNVMFVPLIIEEKTVGLIGLANKPEGFSEKDRRIGAAFGELAAIALRNSRDREALIESEKRLHHSQKMQAIGQLAGGVAHDFNNILGGITGYADLLRLKFDRIPEVKGYAEKIASSARKASHLTLQLLTFARKAPMAKSRVDIHSSIAATLDMFERTIDRKIVIHTELNATPSLLFIDASMFESSLLNLCINARDAMPDGGTLRLTTTVLRVEEDSLADPSFKCVPGRYCRISVSDTGTGMDNATQKHVFEPFFTTKEPGKGTGLGLAGVYGFVKQHDGYITISSRPGEGTTVLLYFPVAKNPATVQHEPIADLKQLRGTGKILVIDDEESIRETLFEGLEDIGYKVIPCKDGLEGIRYFRENHTTVDLVLLDMIMPTMSGLDCFREMRLIHPEVRAVAVSGYNDSPRSEILLNEGFLDFVAKPFAFIDIAVCLHRILSAEEPSRNSSHTSQETTVTSNDGNDKG